MALSVFKAAESGSQCIGRGQDLDCSLPVFDDRRMDFHRGVADILNAAYRNVGEARPQVTVVPMAEMSINQGPGSDQPWVDPLSSYGILKGRPVFHLNSAGMQAPADVLYELITIAKSTS
jgi:hypothetical protein